ncbi:sensor histidine kinase [Undibacterium sp. Jales W-56]|uniref:sensor histidine kinase n=1 Tax=Undibacterium sp. Jales W-56 TaxID=2897325 RepID=UPI0021CE128D|nr:sensor histidine kinase [Undibacterium sp. Jales W-56]MCU6435625.1 sensor histidine kinase [Undibacterium sp. Jales W-56]
MTSDMSASAPGQRYRHRKLFCLLGTLILMAAAASAVYIANATHLLQTARLLTLCGLTGLIGWWLLWFGLADLATRQVVLVPDVTPPLPQDPGGMQDRITTLETRLEHAPIALFAIDKNTLPHPVHAMNGNARRLLAPGRTAKPEQLFDLLRAQAVGKRSMILFETEQGLERALLATSSVTLHGSTAMMVALMPVETELQYEAQQAWQKLVHVLTHEIMNSLTPVASLSRTAHDLLDDLKPDLPADSVKDFSMALDAISRRAHGLADFVGSYRSLSNVPPAHPERVHLNNLFDRLSALTAPAWAARGGRAIFLAEPDSLELMIDPAQFEQALINLIKNAEEATAGTSKPEVVIRAKLSRGGRLRVEISDNGPGVPEEFIPHIFTPFFSTKEKGSGIGLAMVQQLIQGNGGTVRYAHAVQHGARFILTI